MSVISDLLYGNDHLVNQLYDLTEEKIKDLADVIAFLLEDELRADIRYHYIDVSKWEGIVMHYIERADFREIAVSWLRSIQKRQQKD